MPETILIVDDETEIADLIELYLKNELFDVRKFYSSADALACVEQTPFDLAILDIMLPKLNGYQVAAYLRNQHNSVPILMLTAKSDIEDKVQGLNAGADYYLTKPFDARELLACVNALLRRQGSQINELVFGNTRLDLDSAALLCGDNSIRLSAREFEVMRMLMTAGEKYTTKELLLTKVWGYESNAVENHVEAYVSFLRKKLASIGSDVRIEAVRRLGYHLECDA